MVLAEPRPVTEPGRSAPSDPASSVLRQVVRRNLPRLVEETEDVESGGSLLPSFVLDELEAYLACGDPAQGALRLVCASCRHSVFVAFTCRGRSFCPSCGARRVVEVADHLLDRVLPDEPVRQSVLSVPFALRPRVGYDAEAFAAVTRMFAKEVARHQRKQARARGVSLGLCGSVAILQRSGNDLGLNPHIHLIALDGVYRDCARERLEDDADSFATRGLTPVRVARVLSQGGIQRAMSSSIAGRRRLWRVAALLSAEIACSAPAPRPAADEPTKERLDRAPPEVDRLESAVVAVIEGEELPAEPLREAVRRWAAAQPAPPTPAQLRERRASLAEAAVAAELVRREAARRGVTATDAAALAHLPADAGGDALVRSRTGETEAELLLRLRTDLLVDALTAEPPIVVDVRAWRAAHPRAIGSDAALERTLEAVERMRRRAVLLSDLKARLGVREPLRDALRANTARGRALAAATAARTAVGPPP